MALFHKATVEPSKGELISEWAPTQAWYPDAAGEPKIIGAFRFDDPLGQVGMETLLIVADGMRFQVPLTYRNQPVVGAGHAMVGQTMHSALGIRYVYDGFADETHHAMLAGAAMTGQGEALGMVQYDDRWHIAPTNVRLDGGGWGLERVAVDQMKVDTEDDDATVLKNDGFELTIFRKIEPVPGRPHLGLTATWEGLANPVLLAQVRPR